MKNFQLLRRAGPSSKISCRAWSLRYIDERNLTYILGQITSIERKGEITRWRVNWWINSKYIWNTIFFSLFPPRLNHFCPANCNINQLNQQVVNHIIKSWLNKSIQRWRPCDISIEKHLQKPCWEEILFHCDIICLITLTL